MADGLAEIDWWAIWGKALADMLSVEKTFTGSHKAERYVREGRVEELDLVAPHTLKATVRGSAPGPYLVHLRIVQRHLRTSCSCPMSSGCKHGVAVGMLFLYELLVNEAVAAPSFKVLPAAWFQNPPPAPLWSDSTELFLGGFLNFDEVAESSESPGTVKGAAAPRPWWERLTQARSGPEMEGILTEALAGPLGTRRSWVKETIVRELMRHADVFELLDAYERTVRYWVNYEGGKAVQLDPGLGQFLSSEEVIRKRDELRRANTERDLFAWLASRREGELRGTDSVKAHLVLVERARALPAVACQILLSTKTKKDSPRRAQGIIQLSNDIHGGKRVVSDPEARLVHWLGRRPEVEAARYGSSQSLEYIPIRNLMDWLVTWEAERLLRWPDGGVAQIDTTSARLTLRADGEALSWVVELEAGAPRVIPIAEAILFTDSPERAESSSIFLRDGDRVLRVQTSGMPVSLVAGLRHSPRLDPGRLRDSGIGRRVMPFLSRRLPASEAGVTEVPVRTVAELRYTTDGQLNIRCYAKGATGQLFGLGPGTHWIELRSLALDGTVEWLNPDDPAVKPEAVEVSPTALAIVPRPSDVQPLLTWLEEFVPAKSSISQQDGQPADRFFAVDGGMVLDLVAKWLQRPAGITWYGNKGFRDLVSLRAVPKTRLKIEKSGINWLRVSMQYEEELEKLSYEEVMAALAEPASQAADLVMLRGRRVYRREELEEFLKQFEVLHGLGVETDTEEPQEVHALQLAGAAGEKLLAMSEANPRLREFAGRARELMQSFVGVPSAPMPEKIAAWLRPYQRAGADFLAWAVENLGGAVLADDMGLGKTLQVLAVLSSLRTQTPDAGPSLVVCPASVAHNWRREAERFTPGLRVLVIERGNYRRELHASFADYDLVIMNYALARMDLAVLQRYEWLLVVVDEAQTIKNPDATISKAVKTLSARGRIALTGTPIENRLADMGSIVSFAVPGYLKKVAEPTSVARGDAEFALRAMGLRARLRPIMMRRLKSEVATDLPPRIEERRDCEMNPAQKRLYLAEVKKTRDLFQSMEGSRFAGQQRLQMLAALMRLRQICCDPAIAGLQDTGSGKVEEVIPLLRELLEAGNKVLIFSQFVKMINRLQKRFAAESIPFFTLTGQTHHRQLLVDSFEKTTEPSVFLISLKAGGTGLNLTSASHVVLFDPWWNPAVEAQAIDRTHRIGQQRTVVATRLVTLGTIEERILELQEQKRELVANVLTDEAFSRSLSREDLFGLLRE